MDKKKKPTNAAKCPALCNRCLYSVDKCLYRKCDDCPNQDKEKDIGDQCKCFTIDNGEICPYFSEYIAFYATVSSKNKKGCGVS